jgi:hypothetical protein
MLNSTNLLVTVVYDDQATSETAIGDAVEAAAYLDGVRDAVCTIIGDQTTWPVCNDRGEGGSGPCGNLAEVIVRAVDSRFFACRQHAKGSDARASQYEFRFDQADGTVTWTERDRTHTVAVRVNDRHRPDFTADWPR